MLAGTIPVAAIPLVARRRLPPGSRRLIFGAGENRWGVLLLLLALVVLVFYLRRKR